MLSTSFNFNLRHYTVGEAAEARTEKLKVMLQVNTSGEESKFGVNPEVGLALNPRYFQLLRLKCDKPLYRFASSFDINFNFIFNFIFSLICNTPLL